MVSTNPGYTIKDGNFVAASNAVTASYNGQPITFTVTGTLSQTTGLSASGGIDLTILENFLSVSASVARTIENTVAVGSSTATGPPADVVVAGTSYWLKIAPIYNIFTGTMQTWAPSGLQSTGTWTNQELGSPAYDEQIGQSTMPPP